MTTLMSTGKKGKKRKKEELKRGDRAAEGSARQGGSSRSSLVARLSQELDPLQQPLSLTHTRSHMIRHANKANADSIFNHDEGSAADDDDGDGDQATLSSRQHKGCSQRPLLSSHPPLSLALSLTHTQSTALVTTTLVIHRLSLTKSSLRRTVFFVHEY